jgi:hypothetical protein
MKRLFTGITVFVLTLAAAGIMSAQNDSRVGTWKLDVEKSKFDKAASRKDETRIYQATGDRISAHVETTNNDGSKQVFEFDGTSDGKDHPYKGNPSGAETISVKRSGDGFTSDSKAGGKVLFTTTSTVSKDGKTMTLKTKGTNASGQSIASVRVYNKQ